MSKPIFVKGDQVIIKDEWLDAGKHGEVVGDTVTSPKKQDWTPVLWEGEEDPDFIKTAAIRPYREVEFQAFNAWIVVNKETGKPYNDKYYDKEQECNKQYKNVPVTIVQRKLIVRGNSDGK